MASKAALRVSGLLAETICTFICMSTWPKSAVKHERLFMQDPSVYSWQPAIACGLCTALSSGSDGFRQHELALQHASQEMPLRQHVRDISIIRHEQQRLGCCRCIEGARLFNLCLESCDALLQLCHFDRLRLACRQSLLRSTQHLKGLRPSSQGDVTPGSLGCCMLTASVSLRRHRLNVIGSMVAGSCRHAALKVWC